MSKASLTELQLNRATLARQMLLARVRLPAHDAVERLAGMQAQLARPPYTGLWTRLTGFKREELSAQIRERHLVRGTAMRGTLHLLSSRDYLAWRMVLQPALLKEAKAILKKRSDAPEVAGALPEARRFFATAQPFDALRDWLTGRHPKADIRAIAYFIRLQLPLLMVPEDDAPWGYPGQAGFTVAERFLGGPLAKDEDPTGMVLRYLAAFGPATPADAQTWSGLSNLKPAFEALRPKLLTFQGPKEREYFDLPGSPRPPEETPAPPRFLPEFDNLILGHADRSRVIADDHRPKVFTANLQVLRVFLVNGKVAGLWKIDRTKAVAKLAVEPFVKLSKADVKGLEEEGQGLMRFAEPDATTFDLKISKR